MRSRYPVIGMAGLIFLSFMFWSQGSPAAEKRVQLQIPGCSS